MSRFSGAQGKGALRRYREEARRKAEERAADRAEAKGTAVDVVDDPATTLEEAEAHIEGLQPVEITVVEAKPKKERKDKESPEARKRQRRQQRNATSS